MTETTYAIGDVHGRVDLLTSALSAIEAHAGGRPSRIVMLGDYIDRGPHSRGVVELLMRRQAQGGLVCLKGNHEDLMVTALTEASRTAMAHWTRNGGFETLRSYGVGHDDDPMDLIPREHIRWMAGLPITTADPHRIYVHAGLAPNTVFHQQKEETCLWIREAFLRAPAEAFEAHVVHGHTPQWQGKRDKAQPELLPHRTNLDTAAWASGVLTVGVFDTGISGGPVELLTVRAASDPETAYQEEPYVADRGAANAPRRSRWGGLVGRRA
jgi:serine/threonine protein phosphatase 1